MQSLGERVPVNEALANAGEIENPRHSRARFDDAYVGIAAGGREHSTKCCSTEERDAAEVDIDSGSTESVEPRFDLSGSHEVAFAADGRSTVDDGQREVEFLF